MRTPHFRRLAAVIALLLLAGGVVHAQGSYRLEFAARSTMTEFGPDAERDTLEFGAAVYLAPVDPAFHPYAEAAFLDQASSVGVSFADITDESDGLEAEQDGSAFLVTYVDKQSSAIFQALYARTEGDTTVGPAAELEGDALGFAIGSYVTPRSAVLLSYLQVDTEVRGGGLSGDTETVEIALEYKGVGETGTEGFLNVEAGFVSAEIDSGSSRATNTVFAVAVDYYPNRRTGIGVLLAMDSGDNLATEGVTGGVGLTLFVTPSIALSAEFETFSPDSDFVEDSDSLALGAAVRF